MNAQAKRRLTEPNLSIAPTPLQLANLVHSRDPNAVIAEAVILLKLIDRRFNADPLIATFDDVLAMFTGRDPLYRACNTGYHDIHHTLEVFLATARLIHGATVDGKRFSPDAVTQTLMAALFHDIGYLQERGDADGTGAKFTATHVERGIDIVWGYGSPKGHGEKSLAAIQSMMLCTNMAMDVKSIGFADRQTEFLGKILGTADLLAQAADRVYLEKLVLLYREFKEAGVGDYADERDLLRKTIGFFDYFFYRIRTMMSGADRFMRPHFQNRWQIDTSLYDEAIDRNRQFLEKIISLKTGNPLDHLRRGGIVNR